MLLRLLSCMRMQSTHGTSVAVCHQARYPGPMSCMAQHFMSILLVQHPCSSERMSSGQPTFVSMAQTNACASSVQQRQLAFKLLQTFWWVVRYIDDIIAIVPPSSSIAFMERFMYVTYSELDISGIYPAFLLITSTSQPSFTTAKYMDIYAYLAYGTTGAVMTAAYDKRQEPAFRRRIIAIRLQHAGTCLSASCKLNIFDSQFVRYTRIITDADRFVDAIVGLIKDLVAQGYAWEVLMQRFHRRVRTTGMLFGLARGVSRQHMNRSAGGMRGLYAIIRQLSYVEA